MVTKTENDYLSKLKRSLGQKLRHNEKVWTIFIQAYEQCLLEGYTFPFGSETIDKWRNHSKEKLKIEYERNLQRNKYTYRTFNKFFLVKVNHPSTMFGRRTESKYQQFFDTQKRFWTVSSELLKIHEKEIQIAEDKKHELLNDNEIEKIKEHLRKKGSYKRFLIAALQKWYEQTGTSCRDFYKFHYLPYDKKFWDFAKEFEKTFDFEQYNNSRKRYQQKYFQDSKESIYQQRKLTGYCKNIHEHWNKANTRYRNKVCFYKGEYFYLEQLKRKIGGTEKIKEYILSDSEQNRKCFYNGQYFEFWFLCYTLRKSKVPNPYKIAFEAIITK